MAIAYCVKTPGRQLMLQTLTDSIRGVQVNWIVSTGRGMVYEGHTDEQVDAFFKKYAIPEGVTIVKVEVMEIVPQ